MTPRRAPAPEVERTRVSQAERSRAALSPAWLWALFVVAAIAAAGLFWHTRARVQLAERAPLAGRGAGAFAPVVGSRPDGISLAGSGSNLPLTRRLLDAFAARRPGIPLVLHDSIGSSGGVRATRDGAVDIGLVSRELKPEEERGDLVAIPYARTAVVLAAHPAVPEHPLSRAQIVDLYAGKTTAFENGLAAVVLLREPGDSSHAALESRWPEFAEASRASYAARRFRVLFSDQALLRAVSDTPGAVGLSDLGQVRLAAPGLRAFELRDGAGGNERSIAKDLAFVVQRRPPRMVQAFLEFVFSADGRTVIEESGYLPRIPEGRPWE